jgi:hypothetical protein
MTLHVNHRRKLRRRDIVARRKKRRTRHDDANEFDQLVKIFRRRVSSAHLRGKYHGRFFTAIVFWNNWTDLVKSQA